MQPLNANIKRLLLGCVLSNAVIGVAGIGVVQNGGAQVVASATVAPRVLTPGVTAATTIASTDTTGVSPLASAPAATPNKNSSTTRSPSRPSTTAAVAAGDVTGITSSAAPSTPAARVAPITGTYPVTYRGTSSVAGKAQNIPATGTITFATSGDTIKQTSSNAPGNVVLVQRFSDAQAQLVSLQMSASDTTKTFSLSPPVTYLMFNSPAGTAWSWSANSTDGKTHIVASGKVEGTRDFTVGGMVVQTMEITTTLTISGDINGTAALTTWVSPQHRLPVAQHQVINATARKGLFSAKVVSDVTTTLTRLSPN